MLHGTVYYSKCMNEGVHSDIEAVCKHSMPTIFDNENSACYIGLFRQKSVTPQIPPHNLGRWIIKNFLSRGRNQRL